MDTSLISLFVDELLEETIMTGEEDVSTLVSHFKLVGCGIDTLVLNVYYTDDNLKPLAVKRELDEELAATLDEWQARAKEAEEPIASPWSFREARLFMAPHGAGKGQWRWLLTCPLLNVCLSRGRLNGIIAQVRFSSEYLWSKEYPEAALVEVHAFLGDLFGPDIFLQVSQVHLCADVMGWDGESEVWRVEFRFKREFLHEVKQEGVFHGIEDAYDLFDKLPLLWAYAVGHIQGGDDDLPDGWLRAAQPSNDSNRSRWETHPAWMVIQGAFSEESSPELGEVVRERKREVNVQRGLEATIGYIMTLAAWLGGDYAETEADISLLLHWLSEAGSAYLEAKKRDFYQEVCRKRVLYGLPLAEETRAS
jgi:hypothetical protein